MAIESRIERIPAWKQIVLRTRQVFRFMDRSRDFALPASKRHEKTQDIREPTRGEVTGNQPPDLRKILERLEREPCGVRLRSGAPPSRCAQYGSSSTLRRLLTLIL